MATLTTASGFPYPATSETPDVQRDLKALVDYLELKTASWTGYTPTLTGFTLGNGTVQGRYFRLNKLVAFEAGVIFGSTSAGAAAAPALTLPVSALAANYGNFTAQFVDSSAGNIYQALPYQNAVGTVSLYIPGASGLYVVPTNTTPFGAAWAVGDGILIRGVFEAA